MFFLKYFFDNQSFGGCCRSEWESMALQIFPLPLPLRAEFGYRIGLAFYRSPFFHLPLREWPWMKGIQNVLEFFKCPYMFVHMLLARLKPQSLCFSFELGSIWAGHSPMPLRESRVRVSAFGKHQFSAVDAAKTDQPTHCQQLVSFLMLESISSSCALLHHNKRKSLC